MPGLAEPAGWSICRICRLAIFARLGLPVVDGHLAFEDRGGFADMFDVDAGIVPVA